MIIGRGLGLWGIMQMFIFFIVRRMQSIFYWLINTAHERESYIVTDVEEELNRLEESGLLFRDLSVFYP